MTQAIEQQILSDILLPNERDETKCRKLPKFVIQYSD